MIHIHFVEPDSDTWRDWRQQCATEQQRVNDAAQNRDKVEIKSEVYQGKKYNVHKSVYLNPGGPFYGKCAYCEENIVRNQDGDIEHFRPKAAVRDADNRPVVIQTEQTWREHPGYYWLAYDWQNLLPACIRCNQLRRQEGGRLVGKGNRFPVDGDYALWPGEEHNEKPLLLNPTVDDPADHIAVTDLGILLKLSPRGEMCIRIFGLNDRGLPDARREVYTTAREKIGLLLQSLAVDPNGRQAVSLLDQIREMGAGRCEHGAAARKGIKDALASVGPVLDQLSKE